MIVESKNLPPLVTIITITYNLVETKREQYVVQCLESVRRQTYPSIEHIIIDGASKDGTLDLLKEQQKLSQLSIYSEPDKGVYDAMNKGIEKANGKYINFLNSDDFFHNVDAVALSVEYLENNQADYSFADTLLHLENGSEYVWQGDISKLLWGSHYCHQSMFVKTDLLKTQNGFDTSYTVSADTELMMRLYAHKNSYVKVPFTIVSYRTGGHSSQNQLQSRKDHSTAFFLHIGKNIGLNQRDCFLLWNQCFFDEVTKIEQLVLIAKIPEEYGSKHLLAEFINRQQQGGTLFRNTRYFLFGFIPILKQIFCENKEYLWMFDFLLLLKIVNYQKKRKYYLFGILPILKTKTKC